jgi:hypothetical protein
MKVGCGPKQQAIRMASPLARMREWTWRRERWHGGGWEAEFGSLLGRGGLERSSKVCLQVLGCANRSCQTLVTTSITRRLSFPWL